MIQSLYISHFRKLTWSRKSTACGTFSTYTSLHLVLNQPQVLFRRKSHRSDRIGLHRLGFPLQGLQKRHSEFTLSPCVGHEMHSSCRKTLILRLPVLKTGSLLMGLAGAACQKFPEWSYVAHYFVKTAPTPLSSTLTLMERYPTTVI